MHRSPLLRTLPNVIELIYILFVTCVLTLVGNAQLIAERIGLMGSANFISQQASTKVTPGFDTLRSFRFISETVELLIWGGIGLIAYSVLEALIRARRIARYHPSLDSSVHIQPQHVSHVATWRPILSDAVYSFVLLFLFLLVCGGYVILATPTSTAYMQRF
jgi:hypothetical protein